MSPAVALRLVGSDPAPQPVTYEVLQIPISRIRAFAFQPRKWFDPEEIAARAESMRAIGQQDPVTVERVLGDPDHDYDYELINGESRLRSAQAAGLTTLWAAVRSQPFGSRTEKHLASLVANFNRSDHTPMEISDALQVQVTEGGKSQREVARALGKQESWVSQYLALQRLPPEIKALMHPALSKDERVSFATALEFVRLSPERQQEVLRQSRGPDGKIVINRMQVRAQRAEKQSDSAHLSNAWTLERHRERQDHYRPDPRHVAHLRAGIEEFRWMLQARSTR
jgi:ParB/RepB/Spo0J family partition protein